MRVASSRRCRESSFSTEHGNAQIYLLHTPHTHLISHTRRRREEHGGTQDTHPSRIPSRGEAPARRRHTHVDRTQRCLTHTHDQPQAPTRNREPSPSLRSLSTALHSLTLDTPTTTHIRYSIFCDFHFESAHTVLCLDTCDLSIHSSSEAEFTCLYPVSTAPPSHARCPAGLHDCA